MSERALHHVALRVRDVEKSRGFYEGLLGMGTAARPDFGFPGEWYQLGSSQLHLIGQGEGMKWEGIDPTGPHLALEIDDFEAVKADLDARSIEYLAIGEGLLWVRDPDGNVVELREAGRELFG